MIPDLWEGTWIHGWPRSIGRRKPQKRDQGQDLNLNLRRHQWRALNFENRCQHDIPAITPPWMIIAVFPAFLRVPFHGIQSLCAGGDSADRYYVEHVQVCYTKSVTRWQAKILEIYIFEAAKKVATEQVEPDAWGFVSWKRNEGKRDQGRDLNPDLCYPQGSSQWELTPATCLLFTLPWSFNPIWPICDIEPAAQQPEADI